VVLTIVGADIMAVTAEEPPMTEPLLAALFVALQKLPWRLQARLLLQALPRLLLALAPPTMVVLSPTASLTAAMMSTGNLGAVDAFLILTSLDVGGAEAVDMWRQ